jgi:hypothetical protein
MKYILALIALLLAPNAYAGDIEESFIYQGTYTVILCPVCTTPVSARTVHGTITFWVDQKNGLIYASDNASVSGTPVQVTAKIVPRKGTDGSFAGRNMFAQQLCRWRSSILHSAP